MWAVLFIFATIRRSIVKVKEHAKCPVSVLNISDRYQIRLSGSCDKVESTPPSTIANEDGCVTNVGRHDEVMSVCYR